MYRLTNSDSIQRLADNAFIPQDEGNTDYQAYLAWINDGNVPEPADVIPVTIDPVTPRQIRAALNQLGLRTLVEEAVANSDQTTKDAWEFSTMFERDYPLTIALAQALNKSEAEIDELFKLAATL